MRELASFSNPYLIFPLTKDCTLTKIAPKLQIATLSKMVTDKGVVNEYESKHFIGKHF